MRSTLALTEIDKKTKLDGARVGYLVGLNEHGIPLVDFGDNPGVPVLARIAVVGQFNLIEMAKQSASVVLVFENGEIERPIIVGFLYDSTDLRSAPAESRQRQDHNLCNAVQNQRLTIEAKEELTLQCGKGNLTIRKDGKIAIHGSNIISRATQVNKIKGGAVRIN